ncbi:hypothetical protein P8452_48902 [Trifolium repens]|nr:hypothetical protein P8452_48902 [Trifolium repens]
MESTLKIGLRFLLLSGFAALFLSTCEGLPPCCTESGICDPIACENYPCCIPNEWLPMPPMDPPKVPAASAKLPVLFLLLRYLIMLKQQKITAALQESSTAVENLVNIAKHASKAGTRNNKRWIEPYLYNSFSFRRHPPSLTASLDAPNKNQE